MLRKDAAGFDPAVLQGAVAAAALLEHQQQQEDSGAPAAATAASVSSLASTALPQPGQPFRWVLPDDVAPLQGLTHMYTYYRHMYSVWVWYGSLQSVVLLLLMLRLVNKVSFQPRLSIIAGSLAHFLPDFLHFMVVLVVVIVMLAATCNLLYGYR